MHFSKMMKLVVLGFLAAFQLSFGAVYDSAWRQQELMKVPSMAVLYAPLTPFNNDAVRSVNVSGIPALARTAAELGVTVVWTCGGMGQFESLTISERKEINAAWVKAAHDHGLYVIVHVGTTVQQEAMELAAHAREIGADSIASVPPYYEHPSNLDQLFEFFAPIVEAAKPLPLYYYHIPGATGYDIKMADLLAASETKLPALLGIKYVDGDTLDWFNIVQTYNESHVLMFAPEPKLQSFSLGVGRGTILAEDFYAPTYIRMHADFVRGDLPAAQVEQQWKYKIMAIFDKYGGGVAERAIYRKLAGVDLGPRRAPTSYFNESLYDSLISELEGADFFPQSRV